jgi:hypothetical protein
MGFTSTCLAIGKDGAVESLQDFIYNGRNCRVVESLLGCIGSEDLVKMVGASKLLAVDVLGQGDLTVGFIAFDNLRSASCNLFLGRRPASKNSNKLKDAIPIIQQCFGLLKVASL